MAYSVNVKSDRRLAMVRAHDHMTAYRVRDQWMRMAEVDVGDHGEIVKPWVAADYFFNDATGHSAGTLETTEHQT
jgi:hypothetical protein